jgi:PPK2 family polyphosphate:nucleotide phosphotransferase
VTPGRKVRLKAWSTDDTRPFKDREAAAGDLDESVRQLAELQEKLYAQDRWSVLLLLQAMDAAGKDGTIEHVMRGLNPQGCEVYSFKVPSEEEMDHDFLWRAHKVMPRRGHIGVFNRSYYEDVLAVRVHPEILAAQKLPPALVGRALWRQRYEDINAFERYMTRNGTVLVKCFLHVSKKEQLERLTERLRDPAKQWKFSVDDIEKRKHWKDYQSSYEAALSATSTRHAPWHIVPADEKWFTRLTVARLLVEALTRLELAFPTLTASQKRELDAIRLGLEGA